MRSGFIRQAIYCFIRRCLSKHSCLKCKEFQKHIRPVLQLYFWFSVLTNVLLLSPKCAEVTNGTFPTLSSSSFPALEKMRDHFDNDLFGLQFTGTCFAVHFGSFTFKLPYLIKMDLARHWQDGKLTRLTTASISIFKCQFEYQLGTDWVPNQTVIGSSIGSDLQRLCWIKEIV